MHWLKKYTRFGILTFSIPALLLLTLIVSPPLPASAASSSTDSDSINQQSTIPSPDLLRGCGGARFASSNEDFEAEVVAEVNRIRAENQLPPLKHVADLDAAARFHAADMAVEGYFSHTSYDQVNGELVESCKWSDRIQTYYGNWSSLAENIAAGFATPQAVVEGWMNSPGHRTNILSEGNWEIGVGFFQGAGLYSYYWVQDFGRRPNVYPLIIDGEAASTDSGDLTLYIYGDWSEVRLRTDDGAWSDWQPFQRPLSYQLEGLAGLHTVYAEMRASDGAVATASDEILLTQDRIQPDLNEMPDSLSFLLYASSGKVQPDHYEVQPLSEPLAPGYVWKAEVRSSWLNVTPTEGNGPGVLEIIPTVTSADDVNETTATVAVRLEDAQGNVIAEHAIALSLTIVDAAPHSVFVPIVAGAQ